MTSRLTSGEQLLSPQELAARCVDVAHTAAAAAARRYGRGWLMDLDDMRGYACVALMEAAHAYDPRQGLERFRHYASIRCAGAIVDAMRTHDRWYYMRSRRERRNGVEGFVSFSLDEPAPDARSATLCEFGWDESIGSAEDIERDVANAQHADHLIEVIEQLPAKERVVFDLAVLDGGTLREAGAVLGVTESRACQLRQRALKRLRTVTG